MTVSSKQTPDARRARRGQAGGVTQLLRHATPARSPHSARSYGSLASHSSPYVTTHFRFYPISPQDLFFPITPRLCGLRLLLRYLAHGVLGYVSSDGIPWSAVRGGEWLAGAGRWSRHQPFPLHMMTHHGKSAMRSSSFNIQIQSRDSPSRLSLLPLWSIERFGR